MILYLIIRFDTTHKHFFSGVYVIMLMLQWMSTFPTIFITISPKTPQIAYH